tara:strand:- start:37 stop:600 length:564 start_codon:yes stop_codon:yes gene_type:complete
MKIKDNVLDTKKEVTMKIKDNVLDTPEFVRLQDLLMGRDFPWFYQPNITFVNGNDNKFMFYHMFYKNQGPQSPFMNEMNPILNIIKPMSIWRIKANLLTRTPDISENDLHVDIGNLKNSPEKLKQWTTAVFYMNTNNGYTIFEDGTKVECVANRMLTFPSNIKHTGASCTDEKTRVLINFNYFPEKA